MTLSSSYAAKKVGSNQDLLLQIIARLPVTSVLRFKSLSKTCFSLVKELDPHLRLRTSPDPVHGIIFSLKQLHKTHRGGSRDLRFKHHYVPLNPIKNRPSTNGSTTISTMPPGDKPIQSCNGLFLCDKLGKYHVYNPTTLSYTTIKNYPRQRDGISATLAFDPATSLHYKLILATREYYYNYDYHYQIHIYSSETREWSDGCIITKSDGGSSALAKNGVYWNGSVHWIVTALKTDTYHLYNEERVSLRFHVATQTAHKFPEPLKWPTHNFECNYYFGETCGHLHYVDNEVDNYIRIQEMKTDYSEWFVKYRVNLSKVVKGLKKHDYDRDFHFLSVVRSGDQKAILLLWVNKTVMSCNLVNLKLKTVAELGVSWDVSDYAFPFIPCFLMLERRV